MFELSSKKRSRADSESDQFRADDVPFGKVRKSEQYRTLEWLECPSFSLTVDNRGPAPPRRPLPTAENGSTTPSSARPREREILQAMIAMQTPRPSSLNLAALQISTWTTTWTWIWTTALFLNHQKRSPCPELVLQLPLSWAKDCR